MWDAQNIIELRVIPWALAFCVEKDQPCVRRTPPITRNGILREAYTDIAEKPDVLEHASLGRLQTVVEARPPCADPLKGWCCHVAWLR
jgi:hypothetical protein